MNNEIRKILDNMKNIKPGIYAIEAGYIVSITKDRKIIPIRLDIDYIETSANTQSRVVSIDLNSRGEIEKSVIIFYKENEDIIENKYTLSKEQTENYIKLVNISFDKMRSEFREPIDVTQKFKGLNKSKE